MATVVGIMDRDSWRARTDITVVVDPAQRTITWIPRDLWCEPIRNRINAAFARGGHKTLADGLARVGVKVDHSLCLRRAAVERALEDVSVAVPVNRPMRFWYPLEPTAPIEDGRKPIDFDPPAELLSGERLHQWIGARLARSGPSSDFDRIRRQQALTKALLQQGFDFSRVLADPDLFELSDPAGLDELRRVDASWTFACFDRVVPRTIQGMAVLVVAEQAEAPSG